VDQSHFSMIKCENKKGGEIFLSVCIHFHPVRRSRHQIQTCGPVADRAKISKSCVISLSGTERWQPPSTLQRLVQGAHENNNFEGGLCNRGSGGDSIAIAKCRRSYSPRGPRRRRRRWRRRCFGSTRFPHPRVRRSPAARYPVPPVA
jgi:hypothetical protein